MENKRRLTKTILKMIRAVKLLCMIGERESLEELRRIKIINEDLFDMAEARLIEVASFRPVIFKLTEKGNELYKDFSFWGRPLNLLRPDIEEIFECWLKKREAKGGKK
jgi:hypothetical protein